MRENIRLVEELIRSTDDLLLTAEQVEDVRRTQRRDIDYAARNGLVYAARNGLVYEAYVARLDAEERDGIRIAGGYHHDNVNDILDRRGRPGAEATNIRLWRPYDGGAAHAVVNGDCGHCDLRAEEHPEALGDWDDDPEVQAQLDDLAAYIGDVLGSDPTSPHS